jgi:hypothetical protein
MLDNPVLHKLLTDPFFYLILAVIVGPFLVWAGIARAARSNPGILPRLYLPVKVLAWCAWGLTFVWGAFIFVNHQSWRTFSGGELLIINLFNGLNLIRTWIGRRVDPDSFKKHEGWWPTPKDSAPLP